MLTALAILGGGLIVEAYKRRRDREGMALALAGAIDALLRLIEVRDVPGKLTQAMPELEAGRAVALGALVEENGPFRTITMSYAGQLGQLGGDLPFRVARFLTHSEGLQQDVERIIDKGEEPGTKAMLIRQMTPLWDETELLGTELVRDLRRAAGRSARPGRPRRG